MNVYHVTAIHQRLTRLWHEGPPAAEDQGLLAAVVENHRHNFLLWHEDDFARRDVLPAERIREAKGAIDRHNQMRNDAIEVMDRWCIGFSRPYSPCHEEPPDAEVPYPSEIPGMMLDRLSILALREFYLQDCNAAVPAAVPQCLRPAPVPVAQQAGRTAERQAGGAALPLICGLREKAGGAEPTGSGGILPPFLDNREAHFGGGVPGTLDLGSGLRRELKMAAECRHSP